MNVRDIPIELIDQPAAPLRGHIDVTELEELADSIRAIGVRQPLVVKHKGDGFEVVAGHRRLLAAAAAGLKILPCAVLAPEEEGSAAVVMLHENLFRADLTPLEEAALYAELYDLLGDVEKIAAYVHRSRATVESRLALLAGDEKITSALQEKQISLGVAEQLNCVREESTRRFLLDAAINDGASVAKVVAWRKMYHGVDVLTEAQKAGLAAVDPAGERVPDPNICWLCGSAEDQYDLRVRLMHQGCERMMARQAEDQQRKEKVNGGA